jgi:Bifunctional DNA primase/polymerase, N-terminal
MSFLEIALDCLRRGWWVFPCLPETKRPILKHGFLDASNDEQLIRDWWTKWPKANVAIATGASKLTVLDVDHGIWSHEDARVFRLLTGLPENTMPVRKLHEELAALNISRGTTWIARRVRASCLRVARWRWADDLFSNTLPDVEMLRYDLMICRNSRSST